MVFRAVLLANKALQVHSILYALTTAIRLIARIRNVPPVHTILLQLKQ